MPSKKMIRCKGTSAIVALDKELGAADVNVLHRQLKQFIDAGANEITFDMAKTSRIDSSGICLLVAVRNSLLKVKGAVQVVNIRKSLFTLLNDLALTGALHVSAPANDNPEER